MHSMMKCIPRGPRTPRDIIETIIWVEGGHRNPRDILESFKWVEGGHKMTYDPF